MARGFRLRGSRPERPGADALFDHGFKVLLHRTRRRFRLVTARYETPSAMVQAIRGGTGGRAGVATEEPNCAYPLNPACNMDL
jgi:hypothetical protein